MGNHSNYKEEKCWSCAFFCGERKENRGLFGNSVETSSNGTCSCKRCSKYNSTVNENDRGCSKYQKWGVLDSSLAEEEKRKLYKEQRKINQNIIYDQRRQEEELQRQKEELERQTRELERERERLEYERWYSSLSPKEQKAEDARKQEERIKRQKLQEEESKKFNIARINGEIRRLKIKPIKVAIIGLLLTSLPFLIGWFPYYLYSLDIEVNEKFLEEAIEYADDPVYKFYYDQTIEFKHKRAECIWIPFTILFIGLLVTGILCFLKWKKNKIKIEELKKELNELEGK